MILVLLVLLAFPAAAEGRVRLGYQSDNVMCARTSETLGVMQLGRARHVRLMVHPDRWSAQRDCHIRAARLARERGMRVIVQLVRWRPIDAERTRLRPGPAVGEWATSIAPVLAALAPYADAWSPLNEPDHPAFAPEGDPRAVYDEAAAAIRAADPSALLIVGELASSSRRFLRRFRGADADVLGIHYSGATRRPLYRFARRHGLRPWVTEWGVRPGRGRGRAIRRGLRTMTRLGAKRAVYYELFGDPEHPSWDTGLIGPNGPRRGWKVAHRWNAGKGLDSGQQP